MKKIVLFTTGGTISSRVDPTKGAIPVLSGSELANLVPNNEHTNLVVREVYRVGGSQLSPELALKLAFSVRSALDLEGFDGAVITQGTDSVEETSFLLDLLISTERPIVHTASMRNHSELGMDGMRNLTSAIQVASSESAHNHGVLVVMNDRIFAASEVMKTDTINPDSFMAPGRGPLGVIMRTGPVFFHKTLSRQHISTEKIETHVPIIRVALGMDGHLIESALERGARGIVLEGNGAGNLPDSALRSILSAINRQVPIVITSSAFQGMVDDIYGYPGGGAMLRQAGAILGQGLTPAKARIKLMLALGAELNFDQIRTLFEYLY